MRHKTTFDDTAPTLSPPSEAALYLHIPYCRRRCSYCDFNAHVLPDGSQDPFQSYTDALCLDIEQQSERVLTSVFWGGGTPSLLPVPHLRRVMGCLHETFVLPSGTENTIEVNPGTVGEEKFTAYLEAGINRLSIGAQSFHPDHLELVGRIHSAEDIRKCVESARRAGFQNISLDLIYGFPTQTLSQWKETVEKALALEPHHLSVYQLTIEPSTRLQVQLEKGELFLPPEDDMVEMDDWAVQRLSDSGMRRYEISNWALPGYECGHNLRYWADQSYLGLGCGAVSFLDGWRIERIKPPRYYEKAIREGRTPVVFAERRGADGALKDYLMMSLRVAGGVELSTLRLRFPALTEQHLQHFFERLPQDWWKRSGERFQLTRKGWDFHSNVTMELMDVMFSFS